MTQAEAHQEAYHYCSKTFRWLSDHFGETFYPQLPRECIAMLKSEDEAVEHFVNLSYEDAIAYFEANHGWAVTTGDITRISFPYSHYDHPIDKHYLVENPQQRDYYNDYHKLYKLGGYIEETTHAYHAFEYFKQFGFQPTHFALETFACMMNRVLLPTYFKELTGREAPEDIITFLLVTDRQRSELAEYYADSSKFVDMLWQKAKSYWPEKKECSKNWIEFLKISNVTLLDYGLMDVLENCLDVFAEQLRMQQTKPELRQSAPRGR